MRTDPRVSRLSFRYSQAWRTDPFSHLRVPEIDRRLQGTEVIDGRLVVHSLSGHERNHLFLNVMGRQFADISLVSGVDNPADSRGFVYFDYDHDGWLDIALVNANTPLLNLYRNHQGDMPLAADMLAGRCLALRFVGGNRSAEPSHLACRDGYGALVQVAVGSTILKREHRCGEGYGTQNSSTMIVGIGGHPKADSVTVRWPDGKKQVVPNVLAGSVVTLYENPQDSPDGTGFRIDEYQRPPSNQPVLVHDPSLETEERTFELGPAPSLPDTPQQDSQLRVYITTATWCTACIEHLPQFEQLQATFQGQLELVGLPIDENDNTDKLRQYAGQYHPPYRLVLALSDSQRAAIRAALHGKVPDNAVPATIITDSQGRILFTSAGIPTISQIRGLLLRNSNTD